MKLFVISTPSQAFFLSKTSGIVNSNAVLLITKNKEGVEKKIISQLKIFPWVKILIWDITGIGNPLAYYKIFLFRLKMFRLKNKFKDINELFIGSYDNLFHLGIAAYLERNVELFLLYDGLQMVSVAEKRAENREESFRHYSKIFNWAGFKPPNLKSITYTSPLEFEVPVFDKLIKIKGSSNKNVVLKDKLMYFAGQPLVDMGLVTIKYYLNKLKVLKAHFSTSKIVYIPHPKESPETKKEIAKIFEVKYFATIFEQEYLESEHFAGNIISFYSSVLINLYYLAGGDLNIYAIALDEKEILLPQHRSGIVSIYKYFLSNKSSNFKVIDI